MLRPSMHDILKDGQSYYSFVMAVAKRAREISVNAEENNIKLEEKAVNTAVNQFASGEYEFIETEESKGM